MLYKHKEFILAEEDEKQPHSLQNGYNINFFLSNGSRKNDKSEEIHGANQTSALKSLSHKKKCSHRMSRQNIRCYS